MLPIPLSTINGIPELLLPKDTERYFFMKMTDSHNHEENNSIPLEQMPFCKYAVAEMTAQHRLSELRELVYPMN